MRHSRIHILVILLALLLAGPAAWAATKKVTYTMSRVENGGLYYLRLTHSDDTPFDGTTDYVEDQQMSYKSKATFALPDGFTLTFTWGSGNISTADGNLFFNTAVNFSLSWTISRYVTNVRVTKKNGMPSSLNGSGSHTATTDYNYVDQGSTSYTLAEGASFLNLVITYADAPSISVFESAGTKAFYIRTKHDLRHLADYVNKGHNCKDTTFLQAKDIECDNTYTPIGYDTTATKYKRPFRGTYDGQGFTISGINVNRTGTANGDNYIGLFGYTDYDNDNHFGTVRNVILANSTFTGYKYVGGIVGFSRGGIVENCRVESTVTIGTGYDGAYCHGGIAGSNTLAMIRGCVSAANVITNDNKSNTSFYGGIAGDNSAGTIQDCLYIGTNVTAASDTGAITGKSENGALLVNNYSANINLGGVGGYDANGARRGRIVTLGESVTLDGEQNTYEIINHSRLIAIGTGNYALSYYDGSTTTLYSGKTQALTLGFSGSVPTGGVVAYTVIRTSNSSDVTASVLNGTTLTMPDYDVTVSAEEKQAVSLSGHLSYGVYWSTFYDGSCRYTLPAGAQAFTMDSDKHLYRFGTDGRTIPSRKAVVIIADQETVILTPSTDGTVITDHAPNGNILRGGPATVTDGKVDGKTPYVLGVVNDVVGFYRFTGAQIPAGKAYYLSTP